MSEAFEPAPLREEPVGLGWRLPLIIVALLGLGAMAGLLWLGRTPSEPAGPVVPVTLPPLSPEAKAYIPQIDIGGFDLSRWENFLGQSVTYLDLTVSNHGSRSIVALELTIEFFDSLGQVVLRETYRPVGAVRPLVAPRPAPLAAGETRELRVSFEHIPADWNHEPPRVRVSALLLQ